MRYLASMIQPHLNSHAISLLKAISWRIWATCITGLITFTFTKNFKLSLAISCSDTLIKIGLYYLHERGWIKILQSKYNFSPTNYEK